jgi:hypothetical protein
MNLDQEKIKLIRKQATNLIALLDIADEYEAEKKLDELIHEFKKVYPNLNGDANRLKIMGNIHFEEDGKKKHTSVQIYNLKSRDRKELDLNGLQATYKRVVKLCLYIEQLRLYEKVKKLEQKLKQIDEQDGAPSQKKELSKFFDKNERQNFFS